MIENSFLALVHNAALLLAMALLFDLVVVRKQSKKTRLWEVPLGILLGGIGVMVMLTPWVLAPGIIFDTRSVLLGVSGLFFGTIPTVIAMAMAAIFRLYQGGVAAWTGVSVIVSVGVIGILWRRWYAKPLDEISGWQLYLFGIVIHIDMLICMLTLPSGTAWQVLANISLPVMTIYPLGTLLLGLLMSNRLRREQITNDLVRSEARLKSLADIVQRPADTSRDFLDFALGQALQLTQSKIGYIYFYSEERQEFILNTWSKDVMNECAVLDPQTCYELEKTGVWGEAVRQRKPIILNNFEEAHPLKKGYPDGHVKLRRFMTLPIINDGHVVAVVGVANKETDYEEADVLQVTLLLDGVWKIIERRRVEEALRQSEERYEAIIHNLPNGLIHIFDQDLRYVFNAGEELVRLGLTNEMLVGRTLFDVLGPELGGEVVKQYQRVLKGETVHFEGNYNDQSFLLHAAPLRDEMNEITQILVLSLNITDRKRAEEALEKSEALLAKSQEIARVGSWELDLKTSGLTWTDEVYRIFGLAPKESPATYKAFLESIHPEDRAAVDGAYSSSLEEGNDSYEIEHRVIDRGTGEVRYVYEKCVHLRDTAGEVIKSIGMVQDVTERKQAEEKLKTAQVELERQLELADQSRRALLSVVEDQKQAEEQIRQLNAELEQRVRDRTAQLETANKELEAFAYSVSHDLRAPLRALDGFSDILMEEYQGKFDGQGQHYLIRIREASQRMGRLIEDLLNLSRVTRREMSRSQVDLSRVAQQVVKELMEQDLNRKIQFEIEPGIMVYADPNLMRIVLDNLFSNAYKFTAQRESADIEMGLIKQEDEPVYFVRDNGVGFDMAYVNKLFTPFQRLHSVQEFPGTGIGLVTVQRIVSRHGGRIWAEAATGKGATFYFTLGEGL